jgi:hypothetical protein
MSCLTRAPVVGLSVIAVIQLRRVGSRPIQRRGVAGGRRSPRRNRLLHSVGIVRRGTQRPLGKEHVGWLAGMLGIGQLASPGSRMRARASASLVRRGQSPRARGDERRIWLVGRSASRSRRTRRHTVGGNTPSSEASRALVPPVSEVSGGLLPVRVISKTRCTAVTCCTARPPVRSPAARPCALFLVAARAETSACRPVKSKNSTRRVETSDLAGRPKPPRQMRSVALLTGELMMELAASRSAPLGRVGSKVRCFSGH